MIEKIKIGITSGDLNGIGLELLLRTFEDARLHDICTAVVYAHPAAISYYQKALGLASVSISPTDSIEKLNTKALNCVTCWTENTNIQPGVADAELGKFAYQSLERAAIDLAQNKIQVLITAPINKATIHSETFPFKGHTEYFADRFHAEPLMLMLDEELRVATVTTHVPVKDVADQLSIELITKKIAILHQTLVQDFAIERPRIAVLGLNPHAGDEGLIGSEEKTIILPAIQKAKAKHQLVYGPYSADGFFAQQSYEKFDAVLAMYHDQGLIPFKTLSKLNGINYTAGLPIVRCSPDHGTAFDIAGKGEAVLTSFRNAIFTGIDIFKQRQSYLESKQNPLKKGQVNVGYDEIGEMEKSRSH